jgi:hypothetical protein
MMRFQILEHPAGSSKISREPSSKIKKPELLAPAL